MRVFTMKMRCRPKLRQTGNLMRKRTFATLALCTALATAGAASSTAVASPASKQQTYHGATHVAAIHLAPATNNPPCRNPTTRTVPGVGTRKVYYCDISRKSEVHEIPGYYSTLGYLNKAGYANWFVCQHDDYYAQDTPNVAFTEADNGKWGWVDAWAYAGVSSTWPLPQCDAAITERYM
jgi:hypothetical protein